MRAGGRARGRLAVAAVALTAVAVAGASMAGLSGDSRTGLAAATTLAAAPDEVAPTVQYDFDGTTADSSGSGDDATWTGTPAYQPGISGQAAYVRQGLDFLSLPRNASTTPDNGSMSVEFWYKETAESQDGAIFGNLNFASGSANPGMLIYNLFGTTGLSTLFGGIPDSARTTNLFDTTCSWNDVAVVVDASAQTLTTYRNGVQVAQLSTASSGKPLDSGLPFEIGTDGAQVAFTGAFPGSWASGLVDDFDYYNDTAISAGQVLADFNATKPSAGWVPAQCGALPADGGTGFVTPYDQIQAVPGGASVGQPVAGLWTGSTPTSFTKVSGSGWLSVSASGEVTGTAPATPKAQTGSVVVQGTDGTTTHTVTVEVPVLARGQRPKLAAASWNLDDQGGDFSFAVPRELAAIAGSGLGVVGLQGTGGSAAAGLAQALGWYSYQSTGDLGIISAFPVSDVTAPTASAPAAGVTVDVDGTRVRVWVAHLDESGYGPAAACGGTAGPAALVAAEKSSARYAQAVAISREMAPDLAASARTPVLLLGDLASPSGLDWTAATARSHCGTGAVAWPVPAVFAAAGLRDSFRQANPDPVTDAGNTWSLTGDAPAGVPQDRVDYVDDAGHLTVISSEAYYTGWPSQADPSGDDWPSDHAAAFTYFQLG